MLLRTFVFVVQRRRQEGRLQALYHTPLGPERVELRLPAIGLVAYEDLPRDLRGSAAIIREEAEHAVAHRVALLGSGLVELGPLIDWHSDFKSGYRWPERFHKEVEVTRLDDSSDAKVPWELSRCHHLLTLARAARIFGEERYARAFEDQLSSWLEQNPPGIGINWVNPMEVAIRAVNLVWALGTLEEWRSLETDLRNRLVASLRWHGRHIRANLEGAPYLRSNHYLSDILGLLVLGTVLDGEPEAPEWFDFARREFEREVVKQVYPDGVSFEASLAYHGLVLEILVIAHHVASSAGKPFSERFDERLRRMVEVSRTVRHGNGRIPLFGDQDSGRILPAGFARPPTHDNLVWLAASVLGNRRPLEGPVHVEVAWNLGIAAWRRAATLPAAAEPGSAAFPDGGIYVLHSGQLHAVIRCGDVGQNGFGGHSHNDLLSYELSVDGVPLVIDSGTYAYTFDVAARNAFRSTRAHNTLVVDDEEINPIDANRVFELRQFARRRIELVRLDGDVHELSASHDGFRRLTDPVRHRRRFSLDSGTGCFTVRDEVEGRGEHSLESLVHLAPDTALERLDGPSFELALDRSRATVTFVGGEPHQLQVDSGWVSSCYGARRRAPVIALRVRRVCPARLCYSVEPRPRR
jgi:uncharacterized heparinase superfamily protein